VSTNSAAATAKPLTKKELQKFKELLDEKRRRSSTARARPSPRT
jgi:hypothetical protein